MSKNKPSRPSQVSQPSGNGAAPPLPKGAKLDETERLMLQRNAAYAEAIQARIEVTVGPMKRTLDIYAQEFRERVMKRLGIDPALYRINLDTGEISAAEG